MSFQYLANTNTTYQNLSDPPLISMEWNKCTYNPTANGPAQEINYNYNQSSDVYINPDAVPPCPSGCSTQKPSERSNPMKKPKRHRSAFTTDQLSELEAEYRRSRYIDRARRIELSEMLHLSDRSIKVWFQNRRMKEKREHIGIKESIVTSTDIPDNWVTIPTAFYEKLPVIRE